MEVIKGEAEAHQRAQAAAAASAAALAQQVAQLEVLAGQLEARVPQEVARRQVGSASAAVAVLPANCLAYTICCGAMAVARSPAVRHACHQLAGALALTRLSCALQAAEAEAQRRQQASMDAIVPLAALQQQLQQAGDMQPEVVQQLLATVASQEQQLRAQEEELVEGGKHGSSASLQLRHPAVPC